MASDTYSRNKSLMTITQNIVTKAVLLAGATTALFGGVMYASAAAPIYDVSGTYVMNLNYLGTDYAHDMVLAQSATGTVSGHGGSPAGANTYAWTITSGSVSGNTVDFYANYTAGADAVSPLTTLHVMGTVATTGVMSGTWSDNYQGGTRTGVWTTATGVAHALPGTLAAADFGVVNYDSGLGILKGYTAGFGLTNATFAGAQSVVVQLYSNSTLLQTNTAILSKFNADVTGTQFSSPFDVSGTFNYVTDGYWTNVRAIQYGQSVPATRVVATVTLANGKVVTAENTTLVGTPSTIFATSTPPTSTSTTPTKKSQCMNDGWKTFTNPAFTNQGQCIKFLEQVDHGNCGHGHEVKDNDDTDGAHGQGNDNGKDHNWGTIRDGIKHTFGNIFGHLQSAHENNGKDQKNDKSSHGRGH